MQRLLLAVAFPFIAFGERHALLVGINEYSPGPGVTNLQGPVNDAISLSNALTTHWEFQPWNVKLVTNHAATKKAILAELSNLVARVKPGDFVFVYFSGHGTSRFAPGMAKSGLGLDTGAIVTADNALIIGSVHLRPVLRRLDSIARVFASIDACYSGNSVRSLVGGTIKFFPLEAVQKQDLAAYDAQFSQFGEATDANSEYPYRQLLYISAASKGEAAIDIPRAAMASGVRTVDGLPHGAFTNAMLIGLKGAADTNRDGVISYTELYQFVRRLVTNNFPHTPQFLYSPADQTGADSPVFSARSVAPPAESTQLGSGAPASGTVKVKVKLDVADPGLRNAITALTGVRIVTGISDLTVRQTRAVFELFHSSGTLIHAYAPGERQGLLDRIAADPMIRQLTEISYSKQDFNISLDLAPPNRGFFRLAEPIAFSSRPEKDAILLLVNIDVSGTATFIFPLTPAEARPSPAGAVAVLGTGVAITPPLGAEFLKLFAFRTKPPGFDALIERHAMEPLAPTSAGFKSLLELVKADQAGRAELLVKLVTTE